VRQNAIIFLPRTFLAVVALALSASTALAGAPPDRDEVQRILDGARKTWHAPGIAVAIVKDDKASFYTAGMRERGHAERAVTEDTLFGIGSCTKAFTATALALLVDEGKADWDDPVRKHLPWFRLKDSLADRDVTLRDLLCHRTGLARHDWLWYRAPWTIEESVRRMAFLEPRHSFRAHYEYNNLAYLTAGLALAKTAKSPWHEFVRQRLLVPLDMKGVFTSGEAQKAANHATPHSHNTKGEVVVIPWYDDDKQIRASGSIKASVRDLSQWLRFQLHPGQFKDKNGKPLVSAEAFREMHEGQIPIVPMSATARAAEATQESYGLGWHVSDYRGHAIHEHGGAVDGFRARIILVPSKRMGLVLLTNLDDAEIVYAAGNHLLDHLLGLKKKDWNAIFVEERKKAEAARQAALRKRLGNRVPGTKPPGGLNAYVGTYHEPAYGTIKITKEGESLLLNWSSFRLPLRHFHYYVFVPQSTDERVPALLRDEPVLFEMNADAEIATLRFLGRKFVREKAKK
jgi:CubicO group peptidase (beta-lactamase class C family)